VTKIRLLPVVILAIAALLLLKTMGLLNSGGYVLTGVSQVQAAGAGATSSGSGHGDAEAGLAITPAGQPTLEDASPTLTDPAPTLGGEPVSADHGAAGEGDEGEVPHAEQAPAAPVANAVAAQVASPGVYCVEADATILESGEAVLRREAVDAAEAMTGHVPVTPTQMPVPEGSFARPVIDCLPSGDARPMQIGADGAAIPLAYGESTVDSEQQLLERLVARRTELEQYEQDLAMRTAIVDAAEKRIEERTATLQALESQISTLVDQRKEMESGQFAGIVAMYEAMRPKDAAKIFNNLDIEVLLRVAKTMSPRKMAPILAEMEPPRAQELTVKMADLADRPPTTMTPDDLAALPQIVGQ
jgi:flagellar motility protein MotE (MotC chaperone)